MTFEVVLTDTFCGQPNYGWVKKTYFSADETVTDAVLFRRAKRRLRKETKIGLGRFRKVFSNGDCLQYDAVGANLCILIEVYSLS